MDLQHRFYWRWDPEALARSGAVIMLEEAPPEITMVAGKHRQIRRASPGYFFAPNDSIAFINRSGNFGSNEEITLTMT